MRILDRARHLAGLSFALGLSIGAVNSAHAIAVNCPGTAGTGDREFTLTTTVAATCLAYAAGNINGNNDPINSIPPGYVTLDKTDDGAQYGGTLNEVTFTGSGNGPGTFSFVAPSGFTNFVIALKSGQGQLDPDWAAFSLAAGTTSGSWSISSQGLSHINLYGQVAAAVPGPIAGAGLPGLLLASLGWLGWRQRARRQ